MSPRFCALLLQPHGLAAETASVMSFSNHELLRRQLMLALFSPAPDQRYQLPSFEHLLSSDQKAWELLVRRCGSGIRQVGGMLPYDMHLGSALSDLESLLALHSSSAGWLQARQEQKLRPLVNVRLEQAFQVVSQSRSQEAPERHGYDFFASPPPPNSSPPPPPLTQDGQPDRDGKEGGHSSKGEGTGKASPVPTTLLSDRATNDAGLHLCFGYLGACNSVSRGETCDRGPHACTRPGCTRADTHPSYECLRSGLNVAFQVDLQLLFNFKILLRGAQVQSWRVGCASECDERERRRASRIKEREEMGLDEGLTARVATAVPNACRTFDTQGNRSCWMCAGPPSATG